MLWPIVWAMDLWRFKGDLWIVYNSRSPTACEGSETVWWVDQFVFVQWKQENRSVVTGGDQSGREFKDPTTPKQRSASGNSKQISTNNHCQKSYTPTRNSMVFGLSFKKVRRDLKEEELWGNECVSSAEADSGGLKHQSWSSMSWYSKTSTRQSLPQ